MMELFLLKKIMNSIIQAAKYSLITFILTMLGVLIFSFLEINNLKEDVYILTTFKSFLTTFEELNLLIPLFFDILKSLGYISFIVYRLVLGITLLWLI